MSSFAALACAASKVCASLDFETGDHIARGNSFAFRFQDFADQAVGVESKLGVMHGFKAAFGDDRIIRDNGGDLCCFGGGGRGATSGDDQSKSDQKL